MNRQDSEKIITAAAADLLKFHQEVAQDQHAQTQAKNAAGPSIL